MRGSLNPIKKRRALCDIDRAGGFSTEYPSSTCRRTTRLSEPRCLGLYSSKEQNVIKTDFLCLAKRQKKRQTPWLRWRYRRILIEELTGKESGKNDRHSNGALSSRRQQGANGSCNRPGREGQRPGGKAKPGFAELDRRPRALDELLLLKPHRKPQYDADRY